MPTEFGKPLHHYWRFTFLLFCGISLLCNPSLYAQEAASLPSAESVDNETCLLCHGDPSEKYFIDQGKFEHSIHGGNNCTSCHLDITETPHDVPLKKVSCGTCHRIETKVYLQSEHGQTLSQGNTEAATCKACHGDAHLMLNSRDPESPVNRKNIPMTCRQCHSNTEAMKKFSFKQPESVESYEKSVHGLAHMKNNDTAAVCTDCHGSHALLRSNNPASKLHWKNIPETCGKCHENIWRTYEQSIHGKALKEGNRDVPVCTDCHGEHNIDAVKMPTSKVFSSHIPETCGQCHSVARITSKYHIPEHVIETYMESYHGLAVQLGSLTAANCASCHGVHDILPRSDANSSIHPDNLVKTCGKCHAGMGKNVAQGQIHSGASPNISNQAANVVRKFYIILIFSVLGLMLLHNGFDFYVKCRKHYAQMAAHATRVRMGVNERIQHLFLILSFVLLAYTGFALRFPQSWWASPFMGRVDWRSQGHRIGAVIFGILSVYHVLYIIFSKNGRKHLQALFFEKNDFIQMKQMIEYYLGRQQHKPIFKFYGYVEKIEYWALVWGSMIMMITGALMVNEAWFMSHLPKWFFDVVSAIHFYEAVLACSAILIWHGYFAIFDPDEYPMKWTWVSGHESTSDEERA